MPVSDLHRDIARIALHAASRYRVALAGGNALMMHRVIARHTEDVDLFIARERDVPKVAAAVEAALRAAGYEMRAVDDGWGLAEWEVTAPDGTSTQVQAAFFRILGEPVTMPEVGPVLALDDLAGWKTAALASRVAPRDYADVAALLGFYTPGELIALAGERDPGLEPADYADAARRLDAMSNGRLAPYAAPGGVEMIRRRFADWPREPVRGAEARPRLRGGLAADGPKK